MASLIDELISTLEDENEIYKELMVLSETKTPVIVKGDLEELQNITEKEQQFVEVLTKLEKKRIEVVGDIALVLGKDEKDMTIKNIVGLLNGQEKEQKRLSEIHDKLKVTLGNISRVNDINRNLIESSMEMIEFNLNLYKGMYQMPDTGNYNKNAYNTEANINYGGVFDAKN